MREQCASLSFSLRELSICSSSIFAYTFLLSFIYPAIIAITTAILFSRDIEFDMAFLTVKPCDGSQGGVKTLRKIRQQVLNVIAAKCGKLWRSNRRTVLAQQVEETQPNHGELTEVKDHSRSEDDQREEEDPDAPHPRCDWKTIDAIPRSRYEELVARACSVRGPLKPTRVLGQKKGTYNSVSFVGVITRDKCDKYVVRVPGHATVAHWTPQDAYMMQREVEIIEYIRKNTSAPVPQICTYSTDFANILGHPHIMMTMLPGENAYSTWFDEDWEESDDIDPSLNFRFGDLPSFSTEKKRITLLRSLARIMAEVNTLSFDQIGMPIIPLDGSVPPSIGPRYCWDNTGSDSFTVHPPPSSTQDYISSRPNIPSSTSTLQLGAHKLLDIIFTHPIFNPQHHPRETFTLHHADLDLQNILVDDTGNITGLIDWDRCLAVPCCIGAASAPLFLQKDWMPRFLNNLGTSPFMAFDTHRYRQIYAAALAEQSCADAKFTAKSAMYRAGVLALNGPDGDVVDFLGKVLSSIPQFRARAEECLEAFGRGCPAGEWIVRRELEGLFELEMPSLEVLREVDAGIATMDWMVAFEYQSS